MGSVVRVLNAGAEHISAQSKIVAARARQAASNTRKAAESSLAAFSQSLSNNSILDAAGDSINAINENIGRNLDAVSSGHLQSRIAAAEELGANLAAAAANGVGGSSVEMFNQTARLRNAIQEEQGNRAVASDVYLASKSKGDTLKNAVSSFGRDTFVADLDYTEYVDHKKMSGLAQYAALTAAATATYFGGPQAGMAVTDAFMAVQDSRNGDMAGAASGFENAFKGGVKGYTNYRANGPEGSDGEAWGKGLWDSARKTWSNINIK